MSMRTLILLITILPLCCLAQDYGAWRQERIEKFHEIQKLPEKERIPRLSGPMGIKNPYPHSRPNTEQLEVFNLYQTALLAIPGHAEYFVNEMLTTHAAYKQDMLDNRISVNQARYSNAWQDVQRILRNLPSVETVRAVGPLLEDEWTDPKPKERYHNPPSLASIATGVLYDLPIKNKPTAQWGSLATDNKQEAIIAWQRWYQQVKEGRRTFSFEGDPTEYDLNGPVRTGKNPDIPRVTKRPQPAETAPPESPKESVPSRAPWIAAITATLLALGGWLFIRKTRAS